MKRIYLVVILLITLLVSGCKEAIANIEVTEPNNSITFERKAGNAVETTAPASSTKTTATSTTRQTDQTTTMASSSTTVSTTATPSTADTATEQLTSATTAEDLTTISVSSEATTAVQTTTELATAETTVATSAEPSTTNPQGQPSNAVVDYDLTMLSQTMIYSALYNMMLNPEAYIDQTIRIRGEAFSDYDENSQQYYYFVVVTDEAACCQQGVEYRLAGDNYPANGETITIEGIFQPYQYEGDGMSYYRLNEAHIE